MSAREQFLAAVTSFVGTPVQHAGRTPGVGLDCVGVAIAACRRIGMEVDDTRTYDRLPSGDQLRAGLLGYCDEVPVADRIPGDLLQVFFGKQPRHLVVLVGQNECGQDVVVQALGRKAKVRKTLLAARIAACWRIMGVA